jgi:putative membrane-bound dehydrogenase-like protein
MHSQATRFGLILVLALVPALDCAPAQGQTPRIKVLFLGDHGHHQPEARFKQIQPVLEARGIELTYTDTPKALNPETLARYDGLLIYANLEKITPSQEKALLDYVAGGKGFVPIHCASYCFLNSPKYVALVGAQFKSHGTGVFRTVTSEPNHPITRGLADFESWDETYTHHRHNEKDRLVLSYRVEKNRKEPWTWVRKEGKGRVFYTAWGHDARTWGNPGFQKLLERGIRWAVGANPAGGEQVAGPPAMTPQRKDVKPFEYKEAKVPFYPGRGYGGNMALNNMQLPLEPEESLKHLVHPVQFDVQLVAAEPQIYRPIYMTWDEQGRLWIAESVDYPNSLQRKGQGNDRIVICESTRGDGRMDKFTVFADKLSIPTSFTFYKGGVIVHQVPNTIYLKDTDGDGKADVRQVLFTGWGTYDTHAGPSNLRYGLDNWIWGMVGYSGFRGTVGDEALRFGQGFHRFKPDGSKLEFLRSTNNNSWGVGLSEEGIVFGSTANGNPSVYLPIPNRYYESVRGWSSKVLGGIAGNAPIYPITDKVRQVDYHGHFTAAAGHALYTARLYPKQYWNRTAFVCEPTGHLVATFEINKRGSNFGSHNAWNLLASDDEWCAPILAEVGPDGCVWVIDWYNYIVQHNPTPTGFKTGKGNAYETPLRDKTHGRIYRLVPRGMKPAPAFTLKNATPEKLVATLKNDNMFWRLHAQRLLVERGKQDVVPALIALAGDESVDAIGLNPGAIHALWTMQGLGALDGANARATAVDVKALRHKSAGVRRNAVLVLPRTTEGAIALLDCGVLRDPDAQVRLAALLALAEMPPTPRAGLALADLLQRPENADDRWIPDAVTSAAAQHDVHFLGSLAVQQQATNERTLKIVGIVAEHYARGGKATRLDTLLTTCVNAAPEVAEVMLTGLAKGWPARAPVQLQPATEQKVAQLLTRLSPAGKARVLRLATLWGSKGLQNLTANIASTLQELVANEKASDDSRVKAAKQLVELRSSDAKVVETILEQVSPRVSPKLATGLIEALGDSTAPAVGPKLTAQLSALSPTARAAALRVLLSRTESTRNVLDALEKGKVQFNDLTLDQKQALADHPDRKLAARAKTLLARGGGLPNADRQKVIDELLPLMKRTGKVPDGKLVFTKHCAICHTYNGEGNKVGPDLTGMAVHPKEELLVHIMDPSRSVEGNYRLYTVTTQEGVVFNGLLASESKTAIELIDAQAKKHVLLRENLDTIVASNKSLMPDGFEKQLSKDDLVNLLEFLTQRGQFVPLPLAKAATADSTQGMFYDKDNRQERLIFADWGPKTFKGIPFQLVAPGPNHTPNVILFYSPNGALPPTMPKSVRLPYSGTAKTIHLLSGVSGWGYPYGEKGTVSLIVRLHYADGKTEDHKLINGEHFADYIRRVDVPKSEHAFNLTGRQIRYLAVVPERKEGITAIEFIKGRDATAPVIMAVTVETR